MKKIGIIVYDLSVRGGVETVSCALANAFVKEYQVCVISIYQTDELTYELDNNVKYSFLFKESMRLREAKKCIKQPLKELIKKEHIDTVLLQGNYTGYLCSFLKSTEVKKVIFCDHGALMNSWNQKDITLIRFLASIKSDLVVTLTEQSRNDYIRKFHFRRSKIKCIPNWIEENSFISKQYCETSKKIVSAGRFGAEKGFDLLIQVFSLVVKHHPDWQLDIYGDGEERQKIEELIEYYHLEESVNLKGMVSDLMYKYQEYAMYVLPSYKEGLPLVLLESKANRLPIVSFDILTGPKEIVRDGVDGILVNPYDVDKMAREICRLIDNVPLRKEMSIRSQDNIGEFSKDTILGKWKEIL